jgi:general secretion pathway protein D
MVWCVETKWLQPTSFRASSKEAFDWQYHLLLWLTLILSACQTIDDSPRPLAETVTRSARLSDKGVRADHLGGGSPLFSTTRGGPSTVVEGTGRFVGEPTTGATRSSGEAGDDGVTLNLVNVPARDAAKTVLVSIPAA